ncbi:hypothetical protein FJ422_06405 [Mesorhizobium sp. B2-6-3]|nr:hypothetical protein FJW11_06835 [Mesorhizobium sp. B3-1-1]TPJ69098.1 hypothetical protein FJ462_11155 [Mesorhizobium sp. B2-6-7]TPJ87810.1 hypothetical protein FJ422_06405 [Mesorhizobium sp. B2-6-3]TPK00861.1 hypothetical protein FJ491_12195 [Mesorhizobium sp. B2-5-10]TPK12740.1 hypothetical protein FJ490_10075 [Mesorhizobium sp. B2-5-11]TPK33824.1 hypothetical protein FJ885_12185 [Mesorhizobium sp. B2-5-8]
MPRAGSVSGVGAAPHLPAGILSPYSDGERGAFINGFANHQRCGQPFLPVTIRGEMSGRTMRGGADFDNLVTRTLAGQPSNTSFDATVESALSV